jgi:hypothetical protein
VTHGSQVVNFRGTHFGNNVDEIGGITQVSIVQKKLDSGFVSVFVNAINAASVEG